MSYHWLHRETITLFAPCENKSFGFLWCLYVLCVDCDGVTLTAGGNDFFFWWYCLSRSAEVVLSSISLVLCGWALTQKTLFSEWPNSIPPSFATYDAHNPRHSCNQHIQSVVLWGTRSTGSYCKQNDSSNRPQCPKDLPGMFWNDRNRRIHFQKLKDDLMVWPLHSYLSSIYCPGSNLITQILSKSLQITLIEKPWLFVVPDPGG